MPTPCHEATGGALTLTWNAPCTPSSFGRVPPRWRTGGLSGRQYRGENFAVMKGGEIFPGAIWEVLPSRGTRAQGCHTHFRFQGCS